MQDSIRRYVDMYMKEVVLINSQINQEDICNMVILLKQIYNNGGRLFILGVGGGAGNASHAVNDFRKIAGIECYTPADNVSELTAQANDHGWNTIFSNWLKESRFNANDGVLVFSVGGGNIEKNISANIVAALKLAKEVGAKILGVVGRDGGYTAQVADVCVIIPTVNPETVTPHTEAFQSIIWHLLVSHPEVRLHEMKWESVK